MSEQIKAPIELKEEIYTIRKFDGDQTPGKEPTEVIRLHYKNGQLHKKEILTNASN